MKIIIDTHYCSREELAELEEYLEEKCWDYRTDGKEEEAIIEKRNGVKHETK